MYASIARAIKLGGVRHKGTVASSLRSSATVLHLFRARPPPVEILPAVPIASEYPQKSAKAGVRQGPPLLACREMAYSSSSSQTAISLRHCSTSLTGSERAPRDWLKTATSVRRMRSSWYTVIRTDSPSSTMEMLKIRLGLDTGRLRAVVRVVQRDVTEAVEAVDQGAECFLGPLIGAVQVRPDGDRHCLPADAGACLCVRDHDADGGFSAVFPAQARTREQLHGGLHVYPPCGLVCVQDQRSAP